jgi:hypothetical protein
MEDDEQRPAKKHPISISKLSKTPSWVMLGFVLGALFMIALPDEKPVEPRPTRRVEPPQPATPAPSQIAEVQAVFEDPRWKDYIVWADDTTEVAFWNQGTKEFSDLFEVRRAAGVNYFRSVPALTRPFAKYRAPLPDDCPLRFTAPRVEDVRDAVLRTEPAPDRTWKPQPQKKPQIDLPTVPVPDRVAPPSLPTIEITPKAPPPKEK